MVNDCCSYVFIDANFYVYKFNNLPFLYIYVNICFLLIYRHCHGDLALYKFSLINGSLITLIFVDFSTV